MRALALISALLAWSVLGADQKVSAETLLTVEADAVELEFWRSIKDSDDAAEFQAYLAAYPEGTFKALAEIRLSRLEAADGAIANDDTTASVTEEPTFPYDRGWLGVEVVNLNKATMDALGRDDLKGALVLRLVENSPSTGKLRRGDLITRVAETPVHTIVGLIEVVSNTPPGTSVLLQIVRDGRDQSVAVDLGGFAELTIQAADAGSPPDIVRAGLAYLNAQGVLEDRETALSYFREAWAAGDQAGGFWLARALTEGWGTEPDPAEGAALMRELADAGYIAAKAQTAYNILVGHGDETNPIKALVYADEAAEAGESFGRYLMGYMSEGVEGLLGKDIDLAIDHYRQAALRDISGAIENLERLGEPVMTLTEQQERLATMGLYTGKIDGVSGSGTRRAIRQFQRMVGEEETSVMTTALAQRLYRVTEGEYLLSDDN